MFYFIGLLLLHYDLKNDKYLDLDSKDSSIIIVGQFLIFLLLFTKQVIVLITVLSKDIDRCQEREKLQEFKRLNKLEWLQNYSGSKDCGASGSKIS